MLDVSKGSKPLYMQIKEYISNLIKEGKWKPGELIPSEKELQNMFNVSRITVRQAINELVNEGALAKKSGVGTRVLDPVSKVEKFSTIVKGFSHEMQEIGQNPQTFYAKLYVNIKPDEKLKAIFGEELNKGKKLYRLDRVRGYDGKKIVFFKTFLCTNIDLEQKFTNKDFSLYKVLRESGLILSLLEERITARTADKRICKHLNLSSGDTVLVRERFAIDQNNVLAEYSIGYYVPELYTYKIRLNHDFSGNIVLP